MHVSRQELAGGSEAPFPRAALDELGPDLQALVEEVGAPLVGAAAITSIPSARADRACFRLTFADGRVLKGRRVEAEADARRIHALGALLPARHFPRVLGRRGRALLTNWIEGQSLVAEPPAAVLRRCGRMHRALHRLDVGPAFAGLRRRSVDWEPRLDRLLAELVAASALDGDLATEAYRLVVRHAPSRPRAGLCHGDFCGENMVRDRTGTLRVVDNDSLAIDEYEYDLARTWYRWRLSPEAQRAYAEGYGVSEDGAAFAAHFVHWALTVVIESSVFRLRANAPTVRDALERLRRLVQTEGRGAVLPRALAGD